MMNNTPKSTELESRQMAKIIIIIIFYHSPKNYDSFNLDAIFSSRVM